MKLSVRQPELRQAGIRTVYGKMWRRGERTLFSALSGVSQRGRWSAASMRRNSPSVSRILGQEKTGGEVVLGISKHGTSKW